MKNLISNVVKMSAASLSLATVSLSAFARAPVSVPEPSLLGLIGIGAAVLVVARIIRK